MAGGRDFDPERFAALVAHLADERERAGWPVTAEWLAWMMMRCDFRAYARLGQSLTGATYLRGATFPEVREVGVGFFNRYAWRRTPLWARAAGALVAAVVIAQGVRR